MGPVALSLGTYDRKEETIQRVALQEVSFPASGERHLFELVEEAGQIRRIPFHRIREVYRDGRIIWHRQCPVVS